MGGRLQRWIHRRERRRTADLERTATGDAGQVRESREPDASVEPSCAMAGEGVCGDEARLQTPDRDGSELEGSMLEVGEAMAGVMPVERPDAAEDKRKREETSPSSECDTCR